MPSRQDGTESLGPELPEDLLWTEHRAGSVLADRYTIVRRIGSGGYATVYLADDALLRRQVALKVLHPSRIAGHGLARLRREVLVAREVKSPHLVEIYDLVVADGAAFLTMEWVEGETLQERIRREGHLDVDEAIRIGRGILGGLDALHSRGILHRDVKPSNVLLAEEGPVKLLDFGLALHWASDETRITATEAVVGTAEYLSPEQILGKRMGPETDLYAFGATLYEMVAGEPAFGHGGSFQTILARLEKGPRPPSALRPDLPAWLDQVILRLLEQRPEDRYASTLDVERQLETRSSTWITPKRRRRGIWGLVAASLLVAAGVGVTSWLESAGPAFSHVSRTPDGFLGIAEDGSRLWSLDKTWGYLGLARLRPEEPPRVVGVVYDRDAAEPVDKHRLSIIHEETGDVVRTVQLDPPGPRFFPGFSNDYGVTELRIRDLDGDGFDEILATFVHRYWPSYTYLYEPRIERRRLLLVGAGHHRPRQFADLDGDGQTEVLFLGWANRLHYGMGLAAVKVVPWINQDLDSEFTATAFTPGPDLWARRNAGLYWYALLPPDTCVDGSLDCIAVGDEGIRLRRELGSIVELDRSGFPRDRTSPLPDELRRVRRSEAYATAAEARLVADGGTPGEAVPLAERAERLATEAADPLLVEYTRRTLARILIEAGSSDQARELFEEILESSEAPSNVAFEAAEAFHFRGELDRAIGWYRRVFHNYSVAATGRPRSEGLTGLILALIEADRFDEALAEIERLGPVIDGHDKDEILVQAVLWLSGQALEAPEWNPAEIDLYRYLLLELHRVAGKSENLLERIEAELAESSTTRGLVLSLLGEVLAERGPTEEAREAASRAWEISLSEVSERTHYRAFLPLVAERYAAILEELGRPEEAREVRAEAERALAPAHPP